MEWHVTRLLIVALLLHLATCEAIKIRMPAAATNCSTHATCAVCTQQPECGWCDSESSYCATGSANGPGLATECTSGLWKYSNCREDDLCSIQRDCQSCSAQDGCGWCDTRCVAGNREQPKNTDVQCDHYVSRPTACQSHSCVEFTTCDVCTQQSGCSWCQETVFGKQTCLAGDINNRNGDCPAEFWQTNQDQCMGATPCATYQNCSTCLADPSEQCGWCNSNSQCLPRDDPGYCTEFKVNSCNEDCTNFRDCHTCTSMDVCGWCHSGFESVCTYGTPTGPSILNSSRCDWYYETCPQCDYSDCKACERDAGCVWCSVPLPNRNVSECFPLSTQPSNATCSGCNDTSSSPTASATPTISPSTSVIPSVTPSTSVLSSNSSSSTTTPTASSSSTLSATSSPSVSVSASASASGSVSSAPSQSRSASSSASSSVSMSRTSTGSSSSSSTSTSSLSSSPSASPSVSSTSTVSASSSTTPTPQVSQTPTRSPTKMLSIMPPTNTPSDTLSPSPSPSTTVTPNNSNSVPWGMIGLGITIFCILLVVLFGIGAWIFYRFYWLKRWYFVRLE